MKEIENLRSYVDRVKFDFEVHIKRIDNIENIYKSMEERVERFENNFEKVNKDILEVNSKKAELEHVN
jgi:chromosome segregation ATPase